MKRPIFRIISSETPKLHNIQHSYSYNRAIFILSCLDMDLTCLVLRCVALPCLCSMKYVIKINRQHLFCIYLLLVVIATPKCLCSLCIVVIDVIRTNEVALFFLVFSSILCHKIGLFYWFNHESFIWYASYRFNIIWFWVWFHYFLLLTSFLSFYLLKLTVNKLYINELYLLF